jgi:hypothetical protein
MNLHHSVCDTACGELAQARQAEGTSVRTQDSQDKYKRSVTKP